MLELTPEENDMFIKLHRLEDFDKIKREDFKYSNLLTFSLLKRKVIPEVRIAYFNKPEYNLGRGKASRKDVFVRNGRKDYTEIFSHPHFFKYLKYFIMGANLPNELKVRIRETFEDERYPDYGVDAVYKLLKKSKAIPRDREDRKDFAEEKFKHIIDIGCNLSDAIILRKKFL